MPTVSTTVTARDRVLGAVRVVPGARRLVLPVARDMTRRLRGGDLALAAGGLTFYAGIAVVPCLLLAVWATGVVTSPDTITELVRRVADVLPGDLGAPAAVRTLGDAGAGLGMLGALVAAFPATFYGEGLRRAFLRIAPVDESFVGWRGRLLLLPLLVMAPALLLPLLFTAVALRQVGSGLPAVLVGFFGVLLVLLPALAWVFRVVAPAGPRGVALWAGSFLTAACLSGFLQGFTLFLSWPLDLGLPFGGLAVVGAVVALGLWLWVLHLIVLLGWAFTLALGTVLRRGGSSGAASSGGADAADAGSAGGASPGGAA